jgi:Fe-S-cluster containining protein
MLNIDQIPKHKCRNCGACCGPLLITNREAKNIKRFVDRKMDKETKIRLRQQLKIKNEINCQFRDIEKKKCSIYKIRPLICRVFGTVRPPRNVKGCAYGNSHNLDIKDFIDFGEKRFFIEKYI